MVKKGQKILILVDDYTRITPVNQILPVLIQQLHAGGIREKDIELLVASCTHRAMTEIEKRARSGAEIVDNYEVMDYRWREEYELVSLPTTDQGTEVKVNRELLTSDSVVGIGRHIVPHRVAGFSGGAKIVQLGVCGAVTTGQTHWLSARFNGGEITGKTNNPVRDEINKVGKNAGLKFIISTVHDGSGGVYRCVAGEPVECFEEGCKTALAIYGAMLSEPADIVFADAYPADMDLRQAAKGIFSADLALKEGGVVVLVSPYPEGVSGEHLEVADIGHKTYEEVRQMLAEGRRLMI